MTMDLSPSSFLSWVRRRRRPLMGLLGGVGLVWGLLGLVLPVWLSGWIEAQGRTWLGREVTVQQVRVLPWSLTLRVDGLKVAGAADDPDPSPQMAFERLEVNVSAESLWRRAPVVDALRLQGPTLRLAHGGEGRTDVDDVREALQSALHARGPAPAETEPARFALFNLEVQGGSWRLEDRERGVTHRIDDLQLAVPFLSNLPSRVAVVTRPHLAFKLNGSAFDSAAESTPFAQGHDTRLRLRLPDADLAPYLPYWPSDWPLRPRKGVIDLDLQVDFRQENTPQVALSGEIRLKDGALDERVPGVAGDQPWLRWDEVHAVLREVRPLQREVALTSLETQGLEVWVRRDAAGRLGPQRWRWPGPAPGGAGNAPATPEVAPVAAPTPWRLTLDRLGVQGTALHWQDAGTQPAAALSVEGLRLQAEALQWPPGPATRLEGEARLAGAPLSWQGGLDAQALRLEAKLLPLSLTPLAPYVAARLRPPLQGEVAGTVALTWRLQDAPIAAVGAAESAVPGRRLTAQVEGRRWVLATDRREPAFALEGWSLNGLEVDWDRRALTVGALELDRPVLRLAREADGRWPAQAWWLAPAADESSAAATVARQGPGTPEPPWSVQVQRVAVREGRLGWRDASVSPAVALDLRRFTLEGRELRGDGAADSPLQVSMELGVPGQEPGRLRWDGRVRPPGAGGSPASASGQLRLSQLPLHALAPYVASRLNFDLQRAELGYEGRLSWAQGSEGPDVRLTGNLTLEDLRTTSLAPVEPLLDWQSLALRGLSVQVEGGALRRLALSEAVLSDYYARLIVSPQGRLNLQDLWRSEAEGAGTAVVAATSAEAVQGAGRPGVAPVIDVGPITLVHGQVQFSDRFIQPNYSARLSELSGGLSAFSSEPPAPGQAATLAELSLRGRAEGSAELAIEGRLHPLTAPLSLNLRASVRDLELPPLSPYSVKYAGHGIERGRLRAELRYDVDAEGRLQASNQIVLQQLQFGERAPDSDAPNLPVRLAVALLADRQGVIDVELPVSGSLNDPQFRLGPVLWRLVLNLVGKALTAPFALLANALGGGADDLQQVEFAPGQASLSPQAATRLAAVAKALRERPSVKLGIVGRVDEASEREAHRRVRLQQQLVAEKRRQVARGGGRVEDVVAVEAAEAPALLRELYRRSEVPKPRNALGLPRDLPPAEMEALLLAAIPVGEAQWRELSEARALAVRDHLLAAEVAPAQLFIGGETASGPSAGGATPTPRADLVLSVR